MTNFKTLENFKRLNEVQKEAVLHDKGPLLVLAGAGTGKTGVLTTRLSRLLIENIVSVDSCCIAIIYLYIEYHIICAIYVCTRCYVGCEGYQTK